jgi:hypothetical protein
VNEINGLADSDSWTFNELGFVNGAGGGVGGAGIFENSGQKSSKIFAIFFEENWGLADHCGAGVEPSARIFGQY